MMIVKRGALKRKLPKGGCILLRHKVRAHPGPDHDDDVAGLSRAGKGGGNRAAK